MRSFLRLVHWLVHLLTPGEEELRLEKYTMPRRGFTYKNGRADEAVPTWMVKRRQLMGLLNARTHHPTLSRDPAKAEMVFYLKKRINSLARPVDSRVPGAVKKTYGNQQAAGELMMLLIMLTESEDTTVTEAETVAMEGGGKWQSE